MIEPFHKSSVESGLKFPELFPPRTVQSVEMYIQRSGPWMEAHFEDNLFEASFENLRLPTENHCTLNGDGLLSVCVRINDSNKKKHHKICIYDHMTNKLRFLGNIPRHAFVGEFQASNDNDPKLFQKLIGALTHDSRYVAVLAYSANQVTFNVFDVVNVSCLLAIDCSDIGFLQCCPIGIALNAQGIMEGRFQLAIQNRNMEIRVWEAFTRSHYSAKLEGVKPCVDYEEEIINLRRSTLKFSPNGRFLCVPAYFPEEKTCKCVILDVESLEPFCMMTYSLMCREMYSIFPCFTSCGSKFAMLSIECRMDYYDLEKYKYLYFEIPPRIESLKVLCKSTILKSVHISVLGKLPLPSDLITFLGGSDSSRVRTVEKKKCTLM